MFWGSKKSNHFSIDMDCVNLRNKKWVYPLIIIKKILSKLIQNTGYEIRRLPWRSENHKNVYFQIKRLLSNESKPVIFDVGAHTGEMSKRFRKILPNADIYAFEPIPECYNQLKKVFNQDQYLYPYSFAISDKFEEKEFFINHNLGSSSLLPSLSKGKIAWENRALETVSTTTVQCQTLDNFCLENNIENINLLKLDIQGAELNALHGAKRLLINGGISIIYTEISIYQSYKSQGEFHRILSLLHEYNFELFNIYKAIHRSGRLMEIDVMFVKND